MNTKKFLAAIAVLLLLIIALGVGIFKNWQEIKRQNANPAVLARQNIENHDLEAFKRCVDLDNLLESAAEQILSAQINSKIAPTAYSMDELNLQYEKLKPDFVNSAQIAAQEYISTGKIIFPSQMTPAQQFFKKSGVSSCEIKSISKPQKVGNEKIVTVILYNSLLKFNFELELELKPVNDDFWRIVDAKGFENFYNGYKSALKRKLDSLNAPIARKMDDIFKIKSFTIKNSGADEYGFSQTLEINLKVDLKSDKSLEKVLGNVFLGDETHQSPFEIDLSNAAQGLQTFTVTKTLNPFIRADVDAMRHGFKKSDVKIEVSEIIFADGSTLKLLDQLPD